MVDTTQLAEQHAVWEGWAQADPLWAILSDPDRKGGRWDLGEFFDSGVEEIGQVMQDLRTARIEVARGRCLDFGCGVGRLTQGLAREFESADGVDIAETMVALAREHNTHGARVRYHVNERPDLALFEDDTFDFVYCTIVLQHNPPELAEAYIREFVRVCAPGGVVLFDMTTGPGESQLPDGSNSAALEVLSPSRPFLPGEVRAIEVAVTNTSRQDWPSGTHTNLGNHWLSTDGDMLATDDGRTGLHEGLISGGSIVLSLEVTAPNAPGDYLLEVDLVEEGVCWFADRGSGTARIPTVVQRPRRFKRRSDWTNSDGGTARTEQGESLPASYGMHGLPKETVLAALREQGAEVVKVEPSDRGAGWAGFRYFATVPAET